VLEEIVGNLLWRGEVFCAEFLLFMDSDLDLMLGILCFWVEKCGGDLISRRNCGRFRGNLKEFLGV
jgi:hypothetical protein